MSAEDQREPGDQPAAAAPPTDRVKRLGRWVALTILLAAVAGGAALRIVEIIEKRALAHDEAISYLHATGHMAEFARITNREEPPYGTWVRAAKWKRFVRVEDAFCFRRIADGLARYDIHPPMYFWLLHVWSLIFGVHVWTGPTLNLVLATASTLALFGLARRALHSPLAAALVAFIWAVSPTVIPSTLIARQYDLLGLVSILLVYQVLRCSDPGKRPRFTQYALLTIATAAALLTYYHVAVLAVGCTLFIIARLVWRDRRRTTFACTAMAAGLALFMLAHPGFTHPLKAGKLQAQPATSQDVAKRTDNVIDRYSMFCLNLKAFDHRTQKRIRFWACIAAAALTLTLFAELLWHRRRNRGRPPPERLAGVYMLFFFLWTATANIGLYVACITPKHAMAAEHPSMVWPFFAFVPVILLRSLRYVWPIAVIALCVTVAPAGLRQARLTYERESSIPLPTRLLEETQRVIIGKATRGWLPRFVWDIPDDVPVYAADSGYVIRHYREWVDQLERRNLYIGIRPYHELFKRLRRQRGFHVQPVPTGIRGDGYVCMIFR